MFQNNSNTTLTAITRQSLRARESVDKVSLPRDDDAQVLSKLSYSLSRESWRIWLISVYVLRRYFLISRGLTVRNYVYGGKAELRKFSHVFTA
jgi:hypothetical protein